MKKTIKILTIIIFAVYTLSMLSSSSALTIRSVDVFPTEIEPGKTATITFHLENTLNEDIEDISISLDLTDVPFAPHDSSNEIIIDELSEDEDETITFKIIVLNDAGAGVYKIPVKIVYSDEDRDKNERQSIVSITINAEPILDMETEDSLLLKGKNNEIVIRVVNKGLSDVKFLEVEIGSSTKYIILSQKKVYIGDLDSDDFDTADFKLFFKEDVPNTLNLPIGVYYKDVLNKEYNEEFSLPLRVYTEKQAIELELLKKDNTMTYVVVIVVLIIIWIFYRKIRKRRKARKASSFS